MSSRGMGQLIYVASRLSHFSERLIRVVHVVGGFALVTLFGVMSYEVIVRYFLTRPTKWSFDISELLMLPVTYLGAAYIAQRRGHVVVEAVISRLRQKPRNTLFIITSWLSLGFGVLLSWASWQAVLRMYEKHTLTMSAFIPVYPFAVVIPIGCWLLTLQLLIQAIRTTASGGRT